MQAVVVITSGANVLHTPYTLIDMTCEPLRVDTEHVLLKPTLASLRGERPNTILRVRTASPNRLLVPRAPLTLFGHDARLGHGISFQGRCH